MVTCGLTSTAASRIPRIAKAPTIFTCLLTHRLGFFCRGDDDEHEPITAPRYGDDRIDHRPRDAAEDQFHPETARLLCPRLPRAVGSCTRISSDAGLTPIYTARAPFTPDSISFSFPHAFFFFSPLTFLSLSHRG